MPGGQVMDAWGFSLECKLLKLIQVKFERKQQKTFFFFHCLSVPSNCMRNYNFLMFDTDGDAVKCRFAEPAYNNFDCDPCNYPSFLSISLISKTVNLMFIEAGL